MGNPGTDDVSFDLFILDGAHWDKDKLRSSEDIDPSHFLSDISFTIIGAGGAAVGQGVIGQDGASVALSAGDYSIAFSKQGYRDVNFELEVYENFGAMVIPTYRE